MKKFLSLLGTLFGITFVGLLLVPASPAALSVPSWIALLAWTILGSVFYLARRRTIREVPTREMDHQVLDIPVPDEDTHHGFPAHTGDKHAQWTATDPVDDNGSRPPPT